MNEGHKNNEISEASVSIKLNLGCGSDVRDGWINIDIVEFEGVDLILNLENDPLPFEDNEVDVVFASHFLEHVHNLKHLLNEVYRVLKKGGIFHFIVPAWNNVSAFYDPTHVRFFHEVSIMYFTYQTKHRYFGDINFKLKKLRRIRTDHYKRLRKLLAPLVKLFGVDRFNRYVDHLFLNMSQEYQVQLVKV